MGRYAPYLLLCLVFKSCTYAVNVMGNNVPVEEGQLGGIITERSDSHPLLWQTLISVYKAIDMNFSVLSQILNVSYALRLWSFLAIKKCGTFSRHIFLS